MELIERGSVATDVERTAIESVLGELPGSVERTAIGGAAQRGRRHLLLPTLHAVNDATGEITIGAVDLIARHLDVSPAEIYGVATFYDLFTTTESTSGTNPTVANPTFGDDAAASDTPPRQVRVCIDVACRAAGGYHETNLPDGAIAAPCLGLCEQAPATLVIEPGMPARHAALGHVTSAEISRLVAPSQPAVASTVSAPWHSAPQHGEPSLTLLRRVGRVDPASLDVFLADGGFRALAEARSIGADAVIDRIEASGLTGRGGAGFPTGRKWRAVRDQAETDRHVVCNADESEPGTFKDRVLIENDPFALIEAISIAAFAVGASRGWVYLRGEYPRARATLEHALAACRERGLFSDVGDGFDIELRRGAGAYICGEETAIFNSIEGYRGEPRNKPPFPFQAGLFDKPTVVNNVETLMNVPGIVLGESDASRRLFCVSGAVRGPGVYEASIGITLRELIDLAGGLRDGSELQAIMLGGAAGGFAGPDDLDVALDTESLRAVGLTLGSGVVLVHDQSVDLRDQLGRIARFFRHESCGQCVPCRIGTVRQDEALQRGDVVLLGEIGRAMTDASICGLGQTASSAILSAIERLDIDLAVEP